MATFETDTLYGQHVKDSDGAGLGEVKGVFADDETDRPSWIAVSVGLLGSRLSVVPLAQATVDEHGDLRVPFTKGQIKDAPHVDADGDLTLAVEQELYAYYGVAPGTPTDGEATRATQAPSVEPVAADGLDTYPSEDRTTVSRPGAVRAS